MKQESESFKKRQVGIYKQLGSFNHFIPNPLPPDKPPFELNSTLSTLHGEAMHELGRLNAVAARLPDGNRFIKAYVLKEALLSSSIEGIHTTLIDAFTTSLSKEKPDKQTQLVLNYTFALEAALELIQKKGLPVVSRVLLKAHAVLMSGGVGEKAKPGNFRNQAVRIGTLMPAPSTDVPKLMAQLEKYINTDNSLPPLIKAGLAHVQFEVIHPFLDGNGRIGRLLIILILIENKLLDTPILYPSYYFKKNHAAYYYRLEQVTSQGDFEGWIAFYLKAITESSLDAYKRALDIEKLEKKFLELFLSDSLFANARDQSVKSLPIIFQQPVITITKLSQRLNKSYNAASTVIARFVKAKILFEHGEQKRNKLFRFTPYLDLLEKEY